MRILRLLLPLAILAGCQREPTPLGQLEQPLMVHSVVLTGSDTARVYLSRPLSSMVQDPSLPGGIGFSRPVSGADVRLIVGGNTLRLPESPPDHGPCLAQSAFGGPPSPAIEPGCYAALVPGGFRPGESYGLEVRVGGAPDPAQGIAVAPPFPELSRPAAGFRVAAAFGDPFRIDPVVAVIPVHFLVAPSIAAVGVSLSFDAIFAGGREDPDARCSFNERPDLVQPIARADSLAYVVEYLGCFRIDPRGGGVGIVPDSIRASLRLTAFDSTYVRYHEAASQRSAERSSLQGGVTGALGLFAGAASTTTPILLVGTR